MLGRRRMGPTQDVRPVGGMVYDVNLLQRHNLTSTYIPARRYDGKPRLSCPSSTAWVVNKFPRYGPFGART